MAFKNIQLKLIVFMKPHISASILSADFARLGEEVDHVLEAGADRIHVDVMDQHYVPNLTIGSCVLSSLKKHQPNAFYEVHLMTYNIDALIQSFAKSGANLICFHPEINPHTHQSLQLIKRYGCQAGLVINPGVSIGVIEPVLHLLDYVLIMCVNPGFGGQDFLPESLTTIEQTKQLINREPIRLAVDGGINAKTIGQVRSAGADTFISGSYIFHANNYEKAIDVMRNQLMITH